ncbi:hypothetical protein GWK47_053662 [Chionoecetes opilio]|uniref:Uncharacterized protein n=1 Tax=Chionoecetes opilio TaxID=41210 RepID=A0A8J4Y0E9_CHIOP|nr:hypothetical protein GWK47_053662 [Chionoecetes opilio]
MEWHALIVCICVDVSVCFFTLLSPPLSPSCLPVCLHCCVHAGMYTHHCAHTLQRVAEKLAGNGSVSISKAIRNKELEIIPISPVAKSGGGGGAAHGSVPPHRDKSEPKVSISTVAAAQRLSNGAAGWREESASVSIEPCGPAPPMAPGSTDDGPLNLSMKTEGAKAVKIGEKRDHKEAMGSLGLGRAGVQPLDFPGGLGGGLGSVLTPSLEVLQSLYGAQQGESRNVLASLASVPQMQEVQAS